MSLITKSSIDYESDTHIYYNINIINNATDGQKKEFVNFQEIRSSPFLTNPSDYYMSVVRFNLQTPSLPLFIPQIEIGQSNPNKTIYSFTLSHIVGVEVITGSANIIWSSQDSIIPVPSAPLTKQDDSTYYYCYSYQHFYKLMNDALASAYATLAINVSVAGGSLPSSYPPFFEFDVYKQSSILNADMTGYLDTLPNPIKIYANAPMFNLISSYEASYKGLSQGRDYQFAIRNINYTNTLKITNTFTNIVLYSALQAYQEYSTTSLWNPIQMLVFSTSLLPISPTNIAKPLVYNSNTSLTQGGQNNNFSIIMTDFIADTTDLGSSYKPEVLYNPTSEYRLIDMLNSNGSLNNVDIQVYWLDKFNNLNPFYLLSGCSATIKLMFRKKSFNKVGK
jgi:hypothetical protein